MNKGITLTFSIGVAVLSLAAPAKAFDKTKFGTGIVLHCDIDDPPEPGRAYTFSLDFSTMKGSQRNVSGRVEQLALRWVGDGPVLRLDVMTDGYAIPDYNFNLETGIAVGLDATTGQPGGGFTHEVVINPVSGKREASAYPRACQDDHGLIPAPQFTYAGQALIEAEAKPPIEDAKAIAKKLTPAQKKQAQAQFAQAFDLYKAGDFDAAILGFKQGLDIDPSSGLANFYLGESFARTNKEYLAKVRWKRTIDLAPGSKEALQAQARLAHS